MAQYRKKPVVVIVEAIHLTADNVNEVIAFCGDKIKSHPMTGVVIETLDGNRTANVGDYIMRNEYGDFSPLPSDLFEATYELIEENNIASKQQRVIDESDYDLEHGQAVLDCVKREISFAFASLNLRIDISDPNNRMFFVKDTDYTLMFEYRGKNKEPRVYVCQEDRSQDFKLDIVILKGDWSFLKNPHYQVML